MARQFFVLGIGGTGMRCIESLIHLCAMGMFDNTEIHLLALDTDKNNGNFSRLKEVKEAYCNAKGMDPASRTASHDTFFSAQGGLSVAGRCRCLTKDSNTSIEKEGYIPYSLQA